MTGEGRRITALIHKKRRTTTGCDPFLAAGTTRNQQAACDLFLEGGTTRNSWGVKYSHAKACEPFLKVGTSRNSTEAGTGSPTRSNV